MTRSRPSLLSLVPLGIAALFIVSTIGMNPHGVSAWGDGHICDHGVDHAFPDEASYYAYLHDHPGATEGQCQTTTTSTPRSTKPPSPSTVPPTAAATTAAPSTSPSSLPPASSSSPSTTAPSGPTTTTPDTPDFTPTPTEAATSPSQPEHVVPGAPEPSTSSTAPTDVGLPETGSPYTPYEMALGLVVVALGLCLVRIGMRRRPS